MFTIYEDDYAQTSFPRWDSDGAVEPYWDHPSFPGQWSSGRPKISAFVRRLVGRR